jgi:hypothetical protein
VWRTSVQALRAAVAVAASLATCACFEDPIREHLHLTLLGGEVVVITATQDVAPPDVAGPNQPLADRLDEARVEIERGWDRWRPLFDELEPAAERSTLERVDGLARRAQYSAVVPSFEPVERFLGSAGMAAVLAGDRDLLDLQLVLSGSPPATWSEREEVERRLDEWSRTVAEYLAAASALYEHLDRHPDRAVPCLSQLFDSHDEGSGPLGDDEEELLLGLKQQIESVSEVLLVGAEDSYSLNELSRRAFDPFPTRLTVAVIGETVAADGFLERDGYLERPAVDLWNALLALEGRWIAPDLVTTMVAPVPGDLQPDPDPVAFAARARRYGPAPRPDEVATALRAELVPLDLHRVRWRPIALDGADMEIEDPRQVLDLALSGLPP